MIDQQLIDQLERNAKGPQVSRNRNNGKIKVIADFDFGNIPAVTLIASPEAWEALATETVTFENFSRTIRLFRKDTGALKTYAEQWPNDFDADVWRCVRAAMADASRVKPRGGSLYDASLWPIQTAAQQFYVYLRLLKIHKPRGWRDRLDDLSEHYRVNRNDLRGLVMAAIEKEIGFKMLTGRKDLHPDPDNFYAKYIYRRRSTLAWMHQSARIRAGDTPFLKWILSKSDV